MKKRRVKNLKVLWVLLLLLLVPIVSAEPNIIISNSQDWRDVYSAHLYADLIGAKPYFLVSMRHAQLLTYSLPKNDPEREALVVSSSRIPYVLSYGATLNGMGLQTEELNLYSANLELASRLDVNNFIIIDDSYGYNAISVAPYAVVKKSFVLFADKNNIREIVRFLAERDVNELLIYGIVDRDVIESLDSFNPVIINKGDRFSDNIEIVRRYQDKMHKGQAVFTNGEFIEREIMSGEEPVIFIGRNNVPDVVKEYIADSEIEIGVLIGNELVSTATFVRRQLGISVFVKFAQGARAPTGPVSRVEALDMYYLPSVFVNIDVLKVYYNTATGMIEYTYQNLEDVAAFVKGTFTITTELGERFVVGDNESIFLDPGGVITITKPLEDAILGENITARAFVIFGEAPNSLEFTLDKSIIVSTVNVIDNSQVNITAVYYDSSKGVFVIEVENIGDVGAFVDLEIRDLKVGYNLENVGLENIGFLLPGEKKKFQIPLEEKLVDEDILRNKKVKVRAYYGEREGSLVSVIEAQLELQEISGNLMIYIIVSVGVILLLLLFLFKFRIKCDNCKHRNFLWRSHCKKCGNEL